MFHTTRKALSRGDPLQTNRVACDHADLLTMLQTAFVASLSEVETLLRSDAWELRGAEARQVMLEVLFERARERIAPDMPSRLTCAFAWPTAEWARWFRDSYVPDGLIYRCSLRDGTVLVRDAAYLIDNDLSGPVEEVIQRVRPRAECYWLGDQPAQLPEVLVCGIAVVEEQSVDL